MPLLIAKLLLAPALIAAVTVAGRRWGPEVSGWLAGLPITGGPILWFIAVQQGDAFAARTAVAALAGLIAFVAFCLAFAWSARAVAWWAALPVGYAAYFAIGLPVTRWHPQVGAAALAGGAVLLVGALLLPRARDERAPRPPSRWELPARMAATASVVVVVTGLARWLGPAWSGVLTVFPTAATVLGAATLATDGAPASARVLRGLQLGMLCLTGFFAAIAALLPTVGAASAFALGIAAALGGQAVTLAALRFAPKRR